MIRPLLPILLLASQCCRAEAGDVPATIRKVVVLGSSTAAGNGATSTDFSWVGMMTKALAAKGITVINVSISGNSTADAIARFDHDVTALQPDYVVLGTSVVNDGILVRGAAAIGTYEINLRTLIGMVDGIGAVPILIGQYPNTAYDPSMYGLIQQSYRDLQEYGIPVWDFLGPTDDGAGHWLPGTNFDNTHPNNTGHAALFDSIPLNVFDVGPQSYDLSHTCTGSWTLSSRGNIAPVSAVLDRPSGSWSVGVWVKSNGTTAQVTLLGANEIGLSLISAGGVYDLRQSERTVVRAQIGENEAAWHHLFVTYDAGTSLTRFYIDGRLAGNNTSIRWAPLPRVGLNELAAGSSKDAASGYSFSDFVVYRTPLTARDIQAAHSGTLAQKSLAVWLPLSCEPRSRIRNLAPGYGDVSVNGVWKWSPDDPLTARPTAARSPVRTPGPIVPPGR